MDNEVELRANQLFKTLGAAIQGLRLRIEKRVVVPLEDVYAIFQEARRKFEDKEYGKSYDRYIQVINRFREKTDQWEREAQQNLQTVRNSQHQAEANASAFSASKAIHPVYATSHKPGKESIMTILNRLKTEIGDVKKQCNSVSCILTRLRGTLEQLAKSESPVEQRQTEEAKQSKNCNGPLDKSWLEF